MTKEAVDAAIAEQAKWNLLFGDQYVATVEADRLRSVVAEITRRKLEALKLYEPLQEQALFHMSAARIRLLRGSNRGGKTLPAAVEAARALSGCDPFNKYPTSNGRAFVVGKDLDHIGEVMWRKLGRAGAFRIIRDEFTQEWRAYRPWAEYDSAYKEKSKEAPPLIPPRMIAGKVAWESKALGIPAKVTLVNGWEINFFSSLGKPPQGSDLDWWWFDEEIVDEGWYPEMRARIVDRGGRGWWSATPQAGTDVLFDLHERAEREVEMGIIPRRVEEFVILLRDNPHMKEEEKRDLAEDLSAEERRVRVGGEYAVEAYKVYPSYSPLMHTCDPFPVPADWTRVAVIDPGHQVCAVLFAAVPPPTEPDHVYLYDELYLRECDATMFGLAMRDKIGVQRFHTFVMDQHMAIHTEVGAGKNVLEQYAEALLQNKVKSDSTGNSFRLASDNVTAGLTAVRAWLATRANGGSKLRVFRGCLPNFDMEIKRYRKQRQGDIILDKPNNRGACHLMDCLRYLAMYNPRWVKPAEVKAKVGGAMAAFKTMEKQRNKGMGGVRLGPGK